MEGKAFETCLLPNELQYSTKPLLLWQRRSGYTRNFSKSRNMKETSLFSRIKCGSKKFQKPETLKLRDNRSSSWSLCNIHNLHWNV
jgi:hypothetical protein